MGVNWQQRAGEATKKNQNPFFISQHHPNTFAPSHPELPNVIKQFSWGYTLTAPTQVRLFALGKLSMALNFVAQSRRKVHAKAVGELLWDQKYQNWKSLALKLKVCRAKTFIRNSDFRSFSLPVFQSIVVVWQSEKMSDKRGHNSHLRCCWGGKPIKFLAHWCSECWFQLLCGREWLTGDGMRCTPKDLKLSKSKNGFLGELGRKMFVLGSEIEWKNEKLKKGIYWVPSSPLSCVPCKQSHHVD